MSNTDFSDTRTRVQQKYSFGSQAGGLFLQWTHTSGLSTNITCRNFTLGFLKTQLAVASTRNSLGTPWTQSLWGFAIPRVTPKAEEELAAAESLPCCTTGNLSNHFWSIYITYLVCSVSELLLSPILMPEWVWKGARQVMWPESFSQHGNQTHVLPVNRNLCELSPMENQQPNLQIHSPVNIKLSLPYKGCKKASNTFQGKKKFQLLKKNKAHH